MRFEKVSFEQYKKNVWKSLEVELDKLSDIELKEVNDLTKKEYDDIILPKRAYKGSAGYDIYSPVNFSLESGQSIFIWTGIKVHLDANKALFIYPRSSLGIKYKTHLTNTIGLVDADYIFSDNEGHIGISLTNDSKHPNTLVVKKGDRIAQGVIQKYYTVDDDTPSLGRRTGEGFGSSGR